MASEFGQTLRTLRVSSGQSLSGLAKRVSWSKSAVGHAETGERPPSAELARALDAALNAGGRLIALAEAARSQPTERNQLAGNQHSRTQPGPDQPGKPTAQTTGQSTGNRVSRRTAVGLGVIVAVTPATLPAVLRDAAAEAMEFTRETSTSSVGAGTIDHLNAVVENLKRSYSYEDPTDRFALARAYRQKVAQLLRGKHTLVEARELYVNAAHLSELLAWLANDLGSALAAEAYAIDSFEHAQQAGHGEACAWAADAMASIAMYADNPAKAVAAATRGLQQVPTGHPLGVRLTAQAARAHARLGQRDECTARLHEARRRYDSLPARTPIRFGVDTGTLASYAITAYTATSYLWLGEHAEAARQAQAALVVHESARPHDRSPSREAIARIDLAVAQVHLRQPEEAAALGRQALSSSRVVDSVLTRAQELDRALTARFPTLACTRDFHERYEQITHPTHPSSASTA